jgi:hypothetical protein
MSFFKKMGKSIANVAKKATTSVKNVFKPPPKPSPISDYEYNKKIYAQIKANQDSVSSKNSNIQQLTKEIAELYKRLRKITGSPTTINAQPPSVNADLLKQLLLLVAFYKAQLEKEKKDIASCNTNLQKLFNQLQPLKDADISNNIYIRKLQKDLEDANILYNTANAQAISSYDAQRKAQFNQSVSETQTIITDLNNPFVARGDDLVAMLSKYIPKGNADTTYAKIEYRNAEYANLKNTNIIINIIYYIGVIILFVLLFTSNNVFLKERFIFYILLIFLPLLYPWLYLYITQFWQYLFPTNPLTGPKNAFIDESTQPNVYDI